MKKFTREQIEAKKEKLKTKHPEAFVSYTERDFIAQGKTIPFLTIISKAYKGKKDGEENGYPETLATFKGISKDQAGSVLYKQVNNN